MKNFTLLLVCFFLTISANSAFAKLKTWSEYSSDNFTLYSDARTKKAETALEELETFRSAIFTILGLEDRPENQRLKIIMYRRAKDFNEIKHQKNIAGFFTRTSKGPRMIIGPKSRGLEQNLILYHEYIHHIMSEHSNFNYPMWYQEGFSELLSSVTIKNNRINLGLVPEGRASDLIWSTKLKVSELLNPDMSNNSRNYWARFYATSWLLTHYLQISPLGTESKLAEQLSEYKRRHNLGENPTEAFIESFGITPDEMDRKIGRHLKLRRFKMITLEDQAYSKKITKRVLSSNEALFILSDLAWEIGKEELAIKHLSQIDTHADFVAQGLSLRAILENHKDNIELAESLKQQVLTLNQNNSVTLSNIAHLDWDSYNRSKKNKSPEVNLLNDILENSLRASAIDPENIDAYKYQWQPYMEQDNQIEAVRSLMEAYQLDPSSISLNATIAGYLVEIQKPKLALPFAKRVYNWAHSNEQRAWAKEKLDKIEQLIEKSDP